MNRSAALLSFLLLIPATLLPQQEVKVLIRPGISRAIDGNLELQRLKYFNLSESNPGVESKFNDPGRLDYYFHDLEMTFGRSLGLVESLVTWGSSVREDPARTGFADLTHLRNSLSPSNGGASQEFMDKMGPNLDVACHDRSGTARHSPYPDFMPNFGFPDLTDENFPTNAAAAGELAANALKYNFTDFSRPAYYEIVNEPHWAFWGDTRFADIHTQTLNHARALGLETKIGGPCYSVGYFFKNEYRNLDHFTQFIDNTGGGLDFYSFHIYDYMKWNAGMEDFTGSISSGLPTEGVLDALSNYMHKNYDRPFKFVGSEMGGYYSESDEAVQTAVLEGIANKYFPGTGFLWEMKYREIVNYLMVRSSIKNTMTFMNHPHVVEKSVPFILLETSGWNPRYYSSLWVPWNYTDKTNWYETRLIDFYKLFNDLGGRSIYSHTDDPDIQQMGFARGNTLYLAFNNQSHVDALLDLDIESFNASPTEIIRRSYGRLPDLRPYYYEEKVPDLEQLVVEGRGSMVLVITYPEDIPEDEVLNEIPYYGDQVGKQFSGSTSVNISLPDADQAQYAVLRVGLSRLTNLSREVDISFNGTPLEVPEEDCEPQLTGTGIYATTKIILVDTSLLQGSNTIDVSFPDGQSGGMGAAVLRAAYPSTSGVDSIRISNGDIEIYAGQAEHLEAVVLPEVARNKNISWSSGNDAVARVDTLGVVTGVSGGSTMVYATAEDGGLKDSVMVSVLVSPPLKSYGDKDSWTAIYADDEGFVHSRLKEHAVDGDLNTYWHTEWVAPDGPNPLPHEIWVDMGDTLEFETFIYTPRQDQWGPNAVIGDYEVYFSNDTSDWGAADTAGSFSWNIGETDYYKEIQHVDLGTTISARYIRLVAVTEHQNNPEIITSCAAELDVSTDATGIGIADSLSLPVNTSKDIPVRVFPLMGEIAGQHLNWSSLTPSVARVSEGTVTGKSNGSAKIVASTFDGSFSDTCVVSVNYSAASGIEISDDSISLALGKFTWLSAEVLPEDALYRSYRWESEDSSIATVRHGFVEATGNGWTKIIAKSTEGGFTDTCFVEVYTGFYDAVFTIKDKSTGNLLENVMVVFASDTIYTGQDGKAAFTDVSQGTFALLADAKHYDPHGDPSLILDGNIESEIRLEASIYNVSFNVIEEDLQVPVVYADIETDGRKVTTGADGNADLGMTFGSYTYTATEPYFAPGGGSLTVAGDTSLQVMLKRLYADLRIIVRGPGGQPVDGATVIAGDSSMISTALGLADFLMLKTDTLYAWSVGKEGYVDTVNGTISFRQDTTMNVVLTPLGIGSSSDRGGIVVYPNPAGETLWIAIEMGNSSRIDLQLLDLSGRKLLHQEEHAGNNRIRMNMASLQAGTYLLRVRAGKEAETFRIIRK